MSQEASRYIFRGFFFEKSLLIQIFSISLSNKKAKKKVMKTTFNTFRKDVLQRTQILNKLSVYDRREISTALEGYERWLSLRLTLVGKTYASKKTQALDAEYEKSQKACRERVEKVLNALEVYEN